MPIRKITETDITGDVQVTSTPNIVYIPGKATADGIKPKLFKTVAELKAATGYEDDLSHKLAKRLLQLGMYVLYEGCVAPTSPSKGEEISINWDRLKNKTLYNVGFLTTGGYACPSSDMIACAESRGDCIALIDHAKTATSDIKTGETVVGNIRNHMEQFKSEFAAGFTPWFKTRNDILGGSSEKEVSIPASFGYLFAYAKSIKNNPSWLPVAGAARGIIDDLTGVDYEYDEAEINALQKRVGLNEDGDNVGIAINPIAYMGESFGYLIWGNRTLNNNDAAKGLQAKSFLNVRNLVCELKKQIEAASLKYTFEPNNDILWINWQAYLIPTLNRMESGAGILGYKLIREKTTAKARLKARIIIVPIEGVEDFEINVLMSDSLDVTE